MTQALYTRFNADIQVEVLCDDAGRLLLDEACLLGDVQTTVHVREVALHDNHQALVAARTVYEPGLSKAQRELSALGSNPLGQLLFTNGEPRRLHRQFVALDARAPLFALVRRVAGKVREPCWARRTVFLFEHQRLLVTEIFLPALGGRLPMSTDDFS